MLIIISTVLLPLESTLRWFQQILIIFQIKVTMSKHMREMLEIINGSIRYDPLFIWPIYQMLKTFSPRLSLEHFCRLQWWTEPCPDKCWTLPKPSSINFPSPGCSESWLWQLPAVEASGLSDWGGGWLKGWFVGLLWSDLLLSEAAAAAAAICWKKRNQKSTFGRYCFQTQL